MASPKKRAERRRERQTQYDFDALEYAYVVGRCGDAWTDAYRVLMHQEVPFSVFADASWTCPGCPNFLTCTLEGRVLP